MNCCPPLDELVFADTDGNAEVDEQREKKSIGGEVKSLKEKRGREMIVYKLQIPLHPGGAAAIHPSVPIPFPGI